MKELTKKLYATLGLVVMLVICATGIASAQSEAANLYVKNVKNQALDQHKKSMMVPLSKVLEKVGHARHITFVYESDLIEGKTVSKTVLISSNLAHKLGKLLVSHGLTYEKKGKSSYVIKRLPLFRGMRPPAAAAQITGTVTDGSTGKTLPGVNIAVKGTTTGTATDAQGQYELTVESLQDTLIFSFVGYQTQNVPIKGRTEINIKMKTQAISGQEMVVVGYGTQKKENISGAISSVSSKELKDQPVTNLSGALEGKVTGVNITQNSGQPGSNSKVRIRGLTSINNSSPLYVVDGAPLVSNNINAINTSDIASIQILKDASAEAIYGSRGANGVVLIETKQGSKNNSQITVRASGGVQQVSKKLGVLNSKDYVRLNTEAYQNAGQQAPFKKAPSAYTTSTNWQNALFRPAPIQNYDIAFSGGSDNITYRASGGYLNQKGIITGSNYDRLSLRLNSIFNPRKNVEFGEHFSVAKSKQYGVEESTTFRNVVIEGLEMDPTIPVKDKNGNYTATSYSDMINPLAQIHYLSSNNPLSNWDMAGNTYVQYEPVKGLTLKSNLSVDLNFGDTKAFTPQYNVAANFKNPNPSVSHTKSQSFNWTWDNTVTYETDLDANNHIKILGGISQAKYTHDYVNGSNQGQPGNQPYLRYLNAGINNPQVGGQQSQWALLSYIGRLNYNFKQTYFLTATIRRDGSSKFGSGHRYGNFPSASAGWVLTKEPFFPSGSVLNYLKLRGSWGITGNQNSVGYYDYASNISNNYTVFGYPGTAAATAAPDGLPNANLHWEQVNQWDVGLDYRVLSSKLTGSVDYYNKTTKDMLLSLPILSESGFTTGPRSNAGSMLNSGLEFIADYQQHITQKLNLNIGLHFSTIHNNVLSLQQKGEKIYSGDNKAGLAELTVEGHPVASFYGYVDDGIFQNEQQVENHATQPGAAPGDIRFKDVNGDGIIDQNDRAFLGTPIPKLTYGFHFSGNYKNFDFNMHFAGVYGNKIFQAYKFYTAGLFISAYNMGKIALNRWHGEGTSHTIPRLNANDPNHNSRVSSFYLQDGSYLRLRNITLGYTIPQTLLQQANIKNVRVYISAQNLLTFTKYDGYSPEIGTEFGGTGGTLDIGVDPGTYPQPRTISLGANLSF